MSNHPGVDQTLELLERLRSTVREFTAREDKLVQDLRLRLAAVQRRREQAIEELTAQTTEALSQAVAAYRAAKDAAAAKYRERELKIKEAQKAALKDGLAEIENKEGGRKHKLQTETLQARRDRESGLANAEAALAEFKNALAAEQETLAELASKADRSFGGYRSFRRLITEASNSPGAEASQDEHQLIAMLRGLLARTGDDLRRFRRLVLPAFFRLTPVWLFLLLCLIPLAPLLRYFGNQYFSYLHAGAAVAVGLVLGFVLFLAGKRQAEPSARSIAADLAKARGLHESCIQKSEAGYAQETQRIETAFREKSEWINQEWDLALETAEAGRNSLPRTVEEKASHAAATNEQHHSEELATIEQEHSTRMAQLKADAESRSNQLAKTCDGQAARINAEFEEHLHQLEAEWKPRIQPIYDAIAAANASASKLFPPWQPELWKNWTPPPRFESATKFGSLDVDVEKLSEGLPKDKRLALPGAARMPLPLLLTYPRQGSIVFETTSSGRDEAIGALNNLVLRLLSVAPPGRLSFTVIDPVGLGQSFSGVMHLADYAEHLINSRIWTQTSQIEQRLAYLNEHMEKVIQMYLRNEYATIAEYNEQAGNIAEKYHFVVVADFPAAFSDAAARRLLSIAASGARCGVFTLIHWDRRQPMPQDFVPDELRKSSVCLSGKGTEFLLAGRMIPGAGLTLDAPPRPEFAIDFIQKIGISSRDSNRVEVPFEQITPADSEIWSLDTTSELRVPIGRTGATKFQYLAIGKGTRQHALLAGKTGSGKSTLFHVLITNLALWCSPEQVEFYLIDFKKGVEFKCYASNRLPHARVVAIESDREFGLSVLQRLDDELKRRGDLFRKLGVQDIAGYKRAGGTEPIPRSLLIIDEFQEFFVEDDKIAQTASLLLDRIVRQGRAFGIHVFLGSQTLGGAYTVARTTLGQMVIRIALQCNEADAYLIMDDNNPAPRLLSRPGEGIYNDTAGTVEGNSPFQVVWLPDEVRDSYLGKIRERAGKNTLVYPGPIVFEGNAPSDVRENNVLRGLLAADSIKPVIAPHLWLGAPNSIKGPTEAVFHRQSGNNLLLVGQRDEAVLAILSVGLVSLASQYPRNGARFILFDASPPGSPQRDYLERIVQAISHPITVAKPGDLPDLMKGLSDEMARRADDAHAADAPPVFLFIHGLQKFNKLRYEEDFSFSTSDEGAPPNPAILLNNIICEGTRLGFHVIAACDTYNNVNRFLSRKAFSEFELRVLFQMSANDSASLIDSPKASALGLHRALFYNEQEGYLETFRPYALPGNDWIDLVAARLAKLVG